MGQPSTQQAMTEFLSLVEIGVVRRSADGRRIEARRPGSVLFDSADDLGLGAAAGEATARGWIVVAHNTVDGTWMLTAPGAETLARLRPTREPHNLDVGPGPTPRRPIRCGRITFTPHAPGPSWMVDVTDLDGEALLSRLSRPQRDELRELVERLRRRLALD